LSESEQSIWRDTSNARVKLTSSEEFLTSSDISANCKDSYNKYISETDVSKLETNAKGYPKCTWSYDDKEKKFTYAATYSSKINDYTGEPYGWGVMRVPLKESAAENKARMDRLEGKIDEILSILKKE